MLQSEASLVRLLKTFFKSKYLYTIQELSVGYGRADIVAYDLAHDKCLRRIMNAQKAPLERIEYFKILEAFPDEDTGEFISSENLSQSLPFSESRLRYHWLKILKEFGYVEEVGKAVYSKRNGFLPVIKEIVAVEAKLEDWKKGAIQAKRYAVFANRTYLAIPQRIEHRVDRELLIRHRLGLFLVTEDGVEEALEAPESGPKDRFRHRLAGEAAWKLYYPKYKGEMV